MKFIILPRLPSVINSFETPDISLKSNTEGILNILQTLKKKNLKVSFLMQAQVNFMEIIKKFL